MPVADALLKKLFLQHTDHVIVQLFRYSFVGGTASLVDFGSFFLLVKIIGLNYIVAVFFSFTLGTLTNFALCNIFIFQRRTLSLLQACFRHYLSSLGGLVTNWAVMISLIEWLGFRHVLWAKLIAMAVAFGVNFLLIKYFAFNHRIDFKKGIFSGEKK